MAGTDPFRHHTSADLNEILTNAVVDQVRELGLLQLRASGVARRVGVSPQALSQRMAPRPGAEEDGAPSRLFAMATTVFARRWIGWACFPSPGSGIPVRLPVSEEERTGVQAWHAFHELARGLTLSGAPGAHEALAQAQADERAMLRLAVLEDAARQAGSPYPRLSGFSPGPWAGDDRGVGDWAGDGRGTSPGLEENLDAILALVAGLRWSAAAGTGPGPEVAHRLVVDAVRDGLVHPAA